MVRALGALGPSSGAEQGQGPALDVPALEVSGLTKVYKVGTVGKPRTVHALTSADLTIGRAEILGLVGESGSGKSTFARTVAFLERPSAGTMKVDGQEVPLQPNTEQLRRHRSKVQMIFQDPYTSLDPLHKIRYAVSRPLRTFEIAPREQHPAIVNQILTEVGLTPPEEYLRRYPYQLSGGQRQRVGVARALAARPSLLLADEPTSMLDVSIRLNIMNVLLDLREHQGLSMLFVTHDLAGASYMSDRIAIMYAGNLIEIGPTDAVMSEPRHPYTQLLRRAAPDPASHFGREMHFESRGDPPDLTNLPQGCPFAPRCPQARSECNAAMPAWRKVGADHTVRCVLY